MRWSNIFCRYASQEQLQSIYGCYMAPVLRKLVDKHPVWSQPSKITALATTLVNVYEQVRSKFSIDDYGHYLFTPRDLTRWATGLMRYDLSSSQSDNTADRVMEIVIYEAQRLFRDRLVGQEDVSHFDSILNTAIRSDWSGSVFDNVKGQGHLSIIFHDEFLNETVLKHW